MLVSFYQAAGFKGGKKFGKKGLAAGKAFKGGFKAGAAGVSVLKSFLCLKKNSDLGL